MSSRIEKPEPAERIDRDFTVLDELSARVIAFSDERNWSRFQAPKNLAMALSVEASELVEIFQWMSEAESDALEEKTLTHAAEEIADIQIYLLQIAARLGVDLERAVIDKMRKNAVKYPSADEDQ